MVGVQTPDLGGDMTKAVYDSDLNGKFAENELDNGILGLPALYEKIASANKRHGESDNSDEHQVIETGYHTIATFTITNGIKGTLRFKMDLKSDSTTHTLYGRWYANDVAIGTEQSGSVDDTYQSKSEDIAIDLAAGQTLKCKVNTDNVAAFPLSYVRNMNVSYDNKTAIIAVGVT